MSVLVYTESDKGKFKKSALEVASYASALARQMGTEAVALTVNAENPAVLGQYGIAKVLQLTDARLETFNARAIATALQQAADASGAKVIVVSSSADARFMAPLLAGKLKAGYAPNVVALPDSTDPLVVKRTVFSNKGFAHTRIDGSPALIGLSNNAYGTEEREGAAAASAFTPQLPDSDFRAKVTATDKATDKIAIADADIVVSGGRGLKGPENWHMIEELAQVLGAATACSKPVSDMGWRPHSEHVGQTGKPVASNLYVAIGISGAIQHLAGVNASKVKLVINNDPEAPFFKAADYGVVGDAFQVVPELIEKLKQFKAENA